MQCRNTRALAAIRAAAAAACWLVTCMHAKKLPMTHARSRCQSPPLPHSTCALAAASAAQVHRLHGRTRTLSVGSFIAAPPYLTTIVFPRNRCRYGSASDKMVTRSRLVSFFLICTHTAHRAPRHAAPVITRVWRGHAGGARPFFPSRHQDMAQSLTGTPSARPCCASTPGCLLPPLPQSPSRHQPTSTSSAVATATRQSRCAGCKCGLRGATVALRTPPTTAAGCRKAEEVLLGFLAAQPRLAESILLS